MADPAELEARIKRLEDIEAIKQDIEAIKRVKYKYFRCLDSKLWDEMKECFTEDATTDYRSGTWTFQGVDAIVQFLEESLLHQNSVHQGHHPEIEITSDTTARGVWSFND
ncbi:MAG: nuclear transport factor 2 family protein, partial [Chloroflexi bacterium]|nr:nuclear transport factor 2 family protein [Chloroflexota bacterium]